MQIDGSTILITGGTGSFGNGVAVDLSQLSYVIDGVRDEKRLPEAMHGVQFRFHTPALKQVFW